MEISVEELDKLLQKEFDRGKNCFQPVIHTPFSHIENMDSIQCGDIKTYSTGTTACINCPNHPNNGGSGNCNCLLGDMKITS